MNILRCTWWDRRRGCVPIFSSSFCDMFGGATRTTWWMGFGSLWSSGGVDIVSRSSACARFGLNLNLFSRRRGRGGSFLALLARRSGRCLSSSRLPFLFFPGSTRRRGMEQFLVVGMIPDDRLFVFLGLFLGLECFEEGGRLWRRRRTGGSNYGPVS